MKKSILRLTLIASLFVLPGFNSARADIPTNVDYHIAWTNSAGPWVEYINVFGYDSPVWTNGNTAVWIDNMHVEDKMKMVWLEIEWTNQWETVPLITLESEAGALISSPTIITNGLALTWSWTILPQPGWEIVTFSDTWYHDLTYSVARVDIGTLCIPEPSVISLLALGGLALLLRKRR
jgi:hypothetical protein